MEKLFLRSVKILSLTFAELGFEGEHLISDLQSLVFQVWTCGVSGTVQGKWCCPGGVGKHGKVGVERSLRGKRKTGKEAHFFQCQFKSLSFFVPQPLPQQNSKSYYKCRALGSQELGWFANTALGNDLADASGALWPEEDHKTRGWSNLFPPWPDHYRPEKSPPNLPRERPGQKSRR